MRSTRSGTHLAAGPVVVNAVGLVVTVAIAAAACGGSDPSTARSSVDEDAAVASTPASSTLETNRTASTSEAPEPPEPPGSSIVETTVADEPVESWRFPEIASISTSRLLDQSERSSLAGPDSTYYWPDGTIGSVELDDGSVRFFAANGSRIARTRGSVGDLSTEVEATEQTIAGVSVEFSYAAGGPVYRVPGTDTLLLWYHAERHLGGDAANFHAAVGMARSDDLGATFVDLGIIIETNSTPDPAAPCCADVGGAPVIVRDGMFHLYFRDRVGSTTVTDVQLARASAPVDDVVAAALAGGVVAWEKFDDGNSTPGLGGTSSALEAGNPRTNWFDVAWHDGLGRYLIVISVHESLTGPSTLFLTSSVDGLTWTPRQTLVECDCELTYPTFLATIGPERVVGDELSIVYVSTAPTADFRWQDTSVEMATVSLGGGLVTAPTAWSFDDEVAGWEPSGDVVSTRIEDGQLVIEADGADPILTSPPLGLSTDEFVGVRITLSAQVAGVGQVFFTTDERTGIDEARSARFDVSPGQSIYEVHFNDNPAWSGLIDTFRIDPSDQPGVVTIDAIELIPV